MYLDLGVYLLPLQKVFWSLDTICVRTGSLVGRSMVSVMTTPANPDWLALVAGALVSHDESGTLWSRPSQEHYMSYGIVHGHTRYLFT